MHTIQAVVCAWYEKPLEIMRTRRRLNKYTLPRQIAMYLSTKHVPELGLQKIAKEFRRKDHGTVIYARDSIADLLKEEVSDIVVAVEWSERTYFALKSLYKETYEDPNQLLFKTHGDIIWA